MFSYERLEKFAEELIDYFEEASTGNYNKFTIKFDVIRKLKDFECDVRDDEAENIAAQEE